MGFVATPSTQNVKIGVCNVNYNSVDLGYTKGGVEVEVTTDTHEVMIDQFGNTPISEYINGRQVIVRCPLAETTLDNMVSIMPGATKITDATDTASIKVVVTPGVGSNLLSLAQKLILHPSGLTTADVTEDFVVPLAGTAGAIRFAYKLDEERVYNIEFKAYPDSGNILFIFGDETATA